MSEIEIPCRNLMKEKMADGQLAIGMLVRVLRGVEVAAIARSAGFDCVYIDMEHNSFSLETVGQISIAATALGVTPIVRVPGIDPAFISRTLETGAQGVIIPHMETREDAERVVQAAKFPPMGQRSLLGINPHTLFRGGPAAELMEKMNKATLVVGMIESIEAVEAAESIASVEGLDMLIVGTNDLCNSLGVPGQHDHPSVKSAYEKVAKACKKHGVYLGVGGLNSRPEIAQEMLMLGASYISAGSDGGFLMNAASETAKFYRSL